MQPALFEGTPDIPVDNLFHSSAQLSEDRANHSTRPALWGPVQKALFLMPSLFYVFPFHCTSYPANHKKKRKKKKNGNTFFPSGLIFPHCVFSNNKDFTEKQSFSRFLSSKSLFLKSSNNVKPLKPEPGHISVLPGVQQITAEDGSPLRARLASLPRNLLLGHRYTPRASHSSLSLWVQPGGPDSRTGGQSHNQETFVDLQQHIP